MLTITRTNAFLLVVILLLVLWHRFRLRREQQALSRKSKQRHKVSKKAEREAISFLRSKGYKIEAEQKAYRSGMYVDGEIRKIEVRLDILASKRKKKYIIEVKSGKKEIDPCSPQIRRQLREYAQIFPDHKVLLLDMMKKKLYSIKF